MRLIDVDRLIELMNERDADCSEPKNALDIGYSLAVEHMKYEIEQNNEYHCKIYDVDIKHFECKKPKTNADRIRSMSDSEIAEFILKNCDNPMSDVNEDMCDFCNIYGENEGCDNDSCKKAILNFLQSEVEE